MTVEKVIEKVVEVERLVYEEKIIEKIVEVPANLAAIEQAQLPPPKVPQTNSLQPTAYSLKPTA